MNFKGNKGTTLIQIILTMVVLPVAMSLPASMMRNAEMLEKVEIAQNENQKGMLIEAVKLATAEITLNKYQSNTTGLQTKITPTAIAKIITDAETMPGYAVTGDNGKSTVTAVKNDKSISVTVEVAIQDDRVVDVK